MQHIEEAGIHSGDSACVLPPYKITAEALDDIVRITKDLALELKFKVDQSPICLQRWRNLCVGSKPSASRTIPFVSKTTNVPLAKIAAQLATGKKLGNMN
ncbi:MAG: hypothetical protein Ct9H300mP29_6190 [Candidatus Neomarinimicrobiota bacterium]|nr:MAG: hypothetical protein Ct9H300mP29_6190 [Candidatus Neomarinimicrobiota bacterium]